jgi:NAD(P)-dependent dehydrogenase (short-subunit alcohol dehydrogenase family)
MTAHKVAIIAGASQGIGAGLVAGYRTRDWAVVASARTITSSPDPDVLTGEILHIDGGQIAGRFSPLG